MINKKELTVRRYAITSEIPLKQVLDVLKNAGFSCNGDDVVNKDMRQTLLKWYRQEYCKLSKEEKKEKQKLARDAKVARENEASAFAEKVANETLPWLIKNGQIMDLCFELLPEVQQISIMQEMNNKKISEVYVQSYYDYLKAHYYAKKNLELYEAINKNKAVFGDIEDRNLQDLKDEYWGIQSFQNTDFLKPNIIGRYCS